eukprot:1264844-Alexandrium_andersonii.AAC.1
MVPNPGRDLLGRNLRSFLGPRRASDYTEFTNWSSSPGTAQAQERPRNWFPKIPRCVLHPSSRIFRICRRTLRPRRSEAANSR